MAAAAQGPSGQRIIMGLLCVVALIAGCSTKVGENTNPAPTAVITPIGYQATSGAGTASVAITVRSGSAVILSGKDSNGNGTAIASFSWKQTGGSALQVPPIGGTLLYQTSSTVEFTAPQVASDTVLTFQMTVTNALNVSSTGTATVIVTPANDPDEFLVPNVVDNATPPRRFVVAVAPPSQALTPGTPVCVSVNRSVTYTDRNMQQNIVSLPALPNLQANAVWDTAVTAVGAGGSQAQLMAALQSTTNPRVVFDVPVFNDIELAAMFNQALDANGKPIAIPTSSVNQQLVPSDLDTVVLNLSISATPGPCNGTTPDPAAVDGTALALGVYAPGATAPVLTNGGTGPLKLTADALLQAVNPATASTVETLAGAQAYYAAIDPPGQGALKTDLNTWLDANCFDHTQADFGTGAAGANGAHAVYTNNYDLGFGRDMYFIKCAANHTDASGNITAHAGDMAAVVINYGSLEQTALTQAPILAVAMEYQGPGHSNGNCGSTDPTVNKCFTKFYVFAPDDRTGLFQRVSSANFDRRGEKYVPGACLSCHGGSITNATFIDPQPQPDPPVYYENVDAAFMPWDLDALLYSDTDPAFSNAVINDAPYTRAMQEPNLLKLNALAWQTYQTPELKPLSASTDCSSPPTPSATCIDRFEAPRALLMKWYGWCGANGPSCSAAHPYDDNKATSANDWPTATPAGTPTTPSGAPNDLYHAVYAHHCRSCHTQNNVIKNQFNDFKTFSSFLTPGTGANSLQQLVFKNAQMPLARLTSDRFWVDYYGSSTSAAQTLASYINAQAGTVKVDVAQDSQGNTVVVPPGAPVLRASVYSNVNPNTTYATISSAQIQPETPASVARFNGARIDFSSSLFVSSYQSDLCLSQTYPPAVGACTSQSIVGGINASPAFDTTTAGYYNLSLTATSNSGKTAPASQSSFVVHVQRHGLDTNCAPTNKTISIPAGNSGTVVDLTGCSVAQLGDTPLLQVQDSSGNWQPASNSMTPYTITNTSANYTVTINPCIIGPPPSANSPPVVQGCNVVVAYGALATAQNLVVNYRVLDQVDNIPSTGLFVNATLSAQYTANPFSVSATLAPNTTGAAPSTTAISIPLLGTGGFLQGEIAPSNDAFSGAFVLASPGGNLAPSTLTNSTLTATYTTPSNGFSLSNPQHIAPGTDPVTTFVTCDINGNDIITGTPCNYANGNGVNVVYWVQSTSVPPSTATCGAAAAANGSLNSAVYLCNHFQIILKATTSFSNNATTTIYSMLTPMTSCADCHTAPSTPSCPSLNGYCKWQVAADPGDTLTSLSNGTVCNYTDSTSVMRNCIQPGDPGMSQMFQNACGVAPARDSGNHGTQILSPTQCATLSQWIAEGANLN